MRYIVELSGEHEAIARAELAAVLEMAGGTIVEHDASIALADAPDGSHPFLVKRLGLAHAVNAHWWSTSATPRAMLPPFSRVNLAGASFAIRAERIQGAHKELPLSDSVRAAGATLAEHGRVDLKNPEIEIRMFLAEEAHVGARLAAIDRTAFETRHPKNRAHFAPVSIHPKYARALVNLAHVREGDLVADPFCGTGGLLLEAGLVGARVLGSDLDPRMVEGTRMMLDSQGVSGARIETRDVGELPEMAGEPLAAVISDPPYGRSSTTNKEEMQALYERFFLACKEAIKPGGRLAVITPSDMLRELGETHFQLVESFDQRVHRSMTRHWAVFVR